jgi:hypothetical protein
MHDLVQIAIITAATLICMTLAIILMRVSVRALSADDGALSTAFGAFFQELPALASVVLIIVAVVLLTWRKDLSSDACMSLLSAIAGYVLGSRDKRRTSLSSAQLAVVTGADKSHTVVNSDGAR